MRDGDDDAAAASFVCAFSSASLFLFLRRRMLADFLALCLAFSILICRLSERVSAALDEAGATEDDEAVTSSTKGFRTECALVEASGVAIGVSFFLLLLFRLPAASGSRPPEGPVSVSIAVAGDERAPGTEEDGEDFGSPAVAA